MHMPMIAQRAFDTPLLVAPAKAAAFVAGLGPRLLTGRLELDAPGVDPERPAAAGRMAPRASILAGEVGERASRTGRALYAVRDGVAVIEVAGTLVHRGAWLGQSSGVTSYEGLAAQIAAAAEDPAVRGIALEIDSFGGEVAGVFDLADAIRAARAQKPVQAFVAEAALSAGYALASQADRIVVPRTGEVGSIGVVVMHADWSAALAEGGVKVTLIHAGAHKVDGNPFAPLPEDVRATLQAEVEGLRDLFAATVAAGRGARLSAEAALATEARVFRGAEAVAAGLADELADLRTAFAGFAAGLNRRGVVPVTLPAARGPATERTMTDHARPGAEAPEEETVPAEPTQSTEGLPEVAEGATVPVEAPAPVEEPAAAATISRAQAADIARICAQAGRLGLPLDAAAKIEAGMRPEALRAEVLDRLAAQADAGGLAAVAAPARHSAGQSMRVEADGRVAVAGGTSGESPLVAAARRAAEAGRPN
jgi:signal peptide peptidase SppA